MNNFHTIIIGAGAAGIAAGSRLLENNVQNILILEARDRIGGRIHTVEVNRSALDFGAQWCHGEANNVVYSLAKELDVLSPSKNEYNSFNFYSPTLNLDKDVVDRLIVIAASIMDDSEALQNSRENFGDFFERRFLTEIGNHFEKQLSSQVKTALTDWFHKLVNCLNACSTWYTLSARGLVHYKVCDGNYYHQWRNRGYKTILDILMGEFPDPRKKLPIDQKLLLNKIVSKIITNTTDGIAVSCSDGTRYNARYVLVTLPLGVLKQMHGTLFDPQLPSHKVNAINGLGFGTVNKIFIKFPRQWWQKDEKGISIVWSEKDRDHVIREFPCSILKDRKTWLESILGFYPIDSHTNILLVWIVGSLVEEIEKLSDDHIISGLMFVLKYFLKSRYPDMPNPISVRSSKWYSDPYACGSYSYRSLLSDDLNVFASDLAQPLRVDNKSMLMFAGEATSSRQYSTVHGAISSGFREADRIIDVCKGESKSKL